MPTTFPKPAPTLHQYTSTACHHAMHDECRPCKVCGVKCLCKCHAPKPKPKPVEVKVPSLVTMCWTMAAFGVLIGAMAVAIVWSLVK